MNKPIYDLKDLIRTHNRQVHMDIEREMKHKNNGLFTFVLRVNSGNIVDLVTLETIQNGQR